MAQLKFIIAMLVLLAMTNIPTVRAWHKVKASMMTCDNPGCTTKCHKKKEHMVQGHCENFNTKPFRSFIIDMTGHHGLEGRTCSLTTYTAKNCGGAFVKYNKFDIIAGVCQNPQAPNNLLQSFNSAIIDCSEPYDSNIQAPPSTVTSTLLLPTVSTVVVASPPSSSAAQQ